MEMVLWSPKLRGAVVAAKKAQSIENVVKSDLSAAEKQGMQVAFSKSTQKADIQNVWY